MWTNTLFAPQKRDHTVAANSKKEARFPQKWNSETHRWGAEHSTSLNSWFWFLHYEQYRHERLKPPSVYTQTVWGQREEDKLHLLYLQESEWSLNTCFLFKFSVIIPTSLSGFNYSDHICIHGKFKEILGFTLLCKYQFVCRKRCTHVFVYTHHLCIRHLGHAV